MENLTPTSGKYATININFNANKKLLDDFQGIQDKEMDTFHQLVGNALLKQRQGTIWRTDNNSPIEDGKTWFTCADEIPVLCNILKESPSYFKDMNIVAVKVISNEDYTRLIRKKQHIDEMSLDYLLNHIPSLEDIVAEKEKEKEMKAYMDKSTGDFISPTDMLNKFK